MGAYKEECNAMVEVKRALVDDRKQDNLTHFYEMKMIKEEKWKAKAAAEKRKFDNSTMRSKACVIAHNSAEHMINSSRLACYHITSMVS